MKTLSLLLSQPWVQQLGWTLIQFLWQGTVISILFAASRRLLGRILSAQARYALACGTLAAMTAAPVLTFVLMPRLTKDLPPLTSWPLPSPDAWQPVLPWLVALWLFGVVVFSARLIGGWRLTVRLRSVAVRPAPSEWRQKLEELIARIGISTPVKLLVSSLVEVPTVVGWLRPVILMPVGALTGLPPEHAVALLAHELAHIRRLDYLVNIVQSIGEAVLFYHPAVWWVSGEIRAERELCCDDLAVALSGDVETYACALAELESTRPRHSSPALSANGGYLLNRIRRLIGLAPAFDALPGPGAAASMSLLWLIGIGAAAIHGAPPKLPIVPGVAAIQSAVQSAAPAAPAALSLSPISSALLFGPYGPRTTVTATATAFAEPVASQQPVAPPKDIGMEFVHIPAGSFMMGCSPGDSQCSDNEKPAHPVTITKAFDLGKNVVTQGQFEAVMGTNPSHFKWESKLLPVEQVSWGSAQDFLREMNKRQDRYHYRLPTEAEWEYAARAGTTEAAYGSLDAIAWYRANSGGSPHTVGQKQSNAWGVYDMIGNVAEWVQDKYGLYSAGAVNDPTGPIRPYGSDLRTNSNRTMTADYHVVRGSSWGSLPQEARMSVRSYVVPVDQRGSSIGFRVVREESVAPAAPVNSVGMEFIRIPAGNFMMGCSPGDSQCLDTEKPTHKVTITKAFALGKYPVTQAQYSVVTGTNPSQFKGDSNLPVEQVWDHAQDFLNRMNMRNDGFRYRLPTEAEWEYAARAGTTGATYGPLDSIAWYFNNSEGKTHPVGLKQPNAWGLYDMIGNVLEWVKDSYDPYPNRAVSDPEIVPTFGVPVYILRGGSWQSDARLARISYRIMTRLDAPANARGFRVVREPNP